MNNAARNNLGTTSHAGDRGEMAESRPHFSSVPSAAAAVMAEPGVDDHDEEEEGEEFEVDAEFDVDMVLDGVSLIGLATSFHPSVIVEYTLARACESMSRSHAVVCDEECP